VGLALPIVAALSGGDGVGQAGNGDPMAPSRIPTVLALALEIRATVTGARGSIRRECLDHLVIFNERHLRRVLSSYVDYYQRTRTHLSLDKDCPDSRPTQLRSVGRVVAIPKVGGLHHHYERLAA
jgi:hypothetical protein